MTSTRNYKSEAKNVRAAARNTLLEMRRQRLARRQGGDPVHGPSLVGGPQDDAPLSTTLPEPSHKDPTALAPSAEDQFADSSQGMISSEALEPEPLTDPAQNEPSGADLTKGVAFEVDADTTDGTYLAVTESSASDVETDAATFDDGALADSIPKSDLEKLPGAGIGLVWMLQQCGIDSLARLAQADAAELSDELGVVGQILNVQVWIDYARAEQAH